MKAPYTFVVMMAGLLGCDGGRASELAPPTPAEQTGTDEASPDDTANGDEATADEWRGARVDAYGISFARLEDVEAQTEIESGVASARVATPSGVIFSVISSPDIVPPEEATAIQMVNARSAAAGRGRIVDDGGDAPTRVIAGAPREGKQIIYENQAGGTWHTEVFAFSDNDRTINVIVEIPEPPDTHEDVIATLARSLQVRAP